MAKANKTASTKRTMDYYRDQGYAVEKTERWCSFSNRRKDFLGFIDVMVWKGPQWFGIQDTSTGNMGARRKKILASPYAWDWLQCEEHHIFVIGWKKYDKPVERKYWRPTVKEITIADFPNGRPEEETDAA